MDNRANAPPFWKQMYIEPFGGMAGVMMARDRVGTEIYNDIDGRLANWWRIVRDEPAEFGRLVELTPTCQQFFVEALSDVDDMSLPPIRRALAFHIIVTQNIKSGINAKGAGDWRLRKTSGGNKVRKFRREDISALSERMDEVSISSLDATDVLSQMAELPYAVVYCDPPYPSANTSAYLYSDIDKDELTAALLAQRGFCAISGYGDEWAHLGWRRYERKALRRQIDANPSEPRVEVLWINRPRESMAQRLF